MDNVILPEQRIDGFELDPESGVSSANVVPPPFSINPNDTYTVRWDGAVHICIAQSIGDGEEGTVFLGNGSIVGAVGNDEPFLIGVTGTQWVTYIAFDSQAYHTVGIWLGEVQPEEPDAENDANDAVILNYSQNPVRYENVPKVWLTHPDSTEEDVKLVPFTFGEAVSKEVSPDFSAGDMAVDIPAGELVTGLTVKKPEELVPENIPQGMYIAGVGPGEFKGGAETVETTVALDFSGGDMVVMPEDGQSFSAVNIPKPVNLAPENIAEGVNIAGIIGIFAGAGAGGVGSNNVYIKEVTVWSKASGKNSGILTLVTAEELASIRFDTTKPQFVGIFPGSSSNSAYGYISNYGTGTLISCFACNFLLCAAYSGNSYGFYYKGYASNSRVQKAIYEVTTNPFSGNALTNFPYYLNGEIVYDVDNSTMELCNRSTTTGNRKIYVVVGNIIPTV